MLKKIFFFVFLSLFLMSCQFQGAQGKVYTIRLPSNATTGYRWFLESYDKTLLTLKSHKFIPPKTNLLGAPGEEVWEFTATDKVKTLKKSQTVPVKLVYARPWEKEKGKISGETKIVNIVVP